MFVKTGKCTLLYKSKSSAHEIAILSGYSIAVEYSGPDRAPIAAEIDGAAGNRPQRSSVRARVRGGVLYPLYSQNYNDRLHEYNYLFYATKMIQNITTLPV